MSVPVDERLIVQGSPEWLEARKKGIGGSDAPIILGLVPSTWGTPYSLWLSKTDPGFVAPAESQKQRWGKHHEYKMREEYQFLTGNRLIEMPAIVHHPKHNWMFGSLDGATDNRRAVEFKCTTWRDGWGEPGSDEVPLNYAAQTQHYMEVTGLPVTDLCVLVAGWDFRIYHVEYDRELAEQLVHEEHEFWKLVESRTPPPITTEKDAVQRWGRSNAKGTVDLDMMTAQAMGRLKEIKSAQDALKAEAEPLRSLVIGAFGDNGDTMVDSRGMTVATYKLIKGSTFTVTREPARRLDIK